MDSSQDMDGRYVVKLGRLQYSLLRIERRAKETRQYLDRVCSSRPTDEKRLSHDETVERKRRCRRTGLLGMPGCEKICGVATL